MKVLKSAPRGAGMFLGVVFLACASGAAHGDPMQTGNLTVTGITTGWNADQFRIETTQQTVINPASCSTPDGYVSEASTNPGHKTHYAAVLYGMATGKTISLVVSDTACASGRPKIIGVNVR